jgi:hypothetical protein
MTHGLLVSRSTKLKLAKKCFQYPSHDNNAAYKLYRNLYNNLVRNSKKSYFAKILELNVNNLKKTWSILNEAINKKGVQNSISEIICNSTILNNPFEIAQKFNNFFTSVAASFSSGINPADTVIDDNPITNARFEMSSVPVTSEELGLALNNLQDKKTPDLNNVSIHCVRVPLLHIFNCSLSSGSVPDKMKIAKVVPIFKSGNQTDINNYRPISLLCSFSKVLEKIVANRLTHYLNSNNLISPNQFGFRSKHSTVHPMFNQQQKILFGNIL